MAFGVFAYSPEAVGFWASQVGFTWLPGCRLPEQQMYAVDEPGRSLSLSAKSHPKPPLFSAKSSSFLRLGMYTIE